MPAEFCPHCMQTLSPGELFCPRCGREADQQAAPYQLPIGTVLRTDKGHVFLFGEAKGGGGFGSAQDSGGGAGLRREGGHAERG